MQGLGLKSSKASEKRKFKIELKTMMKNKKKRPSGNRQTPCYVWVLMLHGNGDVGHA